MMKSAAIIPVAFLVALLGQASYAKVVKFETGEGGFLELEVKIDKTVAYDENQNNVLFMVALKTAHNVTEYLERISSDEFTNTLVARSSEKVRLARNFKELSEKFCEPIREFGVTKQQLARLKMGFEFITELLSGSRKILVSEYEDVKFSKSEIERHAHDLLYAIYEDLRLEELLASHDLRINGLPIEDIIKDYVNILRGMNRSSSISILRDALAQLSGKLMSC